MNRPIKFRAWNGYRMYYDDLTVVGPDIGLNALLGVTAKAYELMQYTGLHDKNGKEIYEGDIINDFGGGVWKQCRARKCDHKDKGLHYIEPEDRERRGVIEFAEGYFGVKVDSMDYVYIPTPKGSSLKWEVIGNTYENPNLLPDGH